VDAGAAFYILSLERRVGWSDGVVDVDSLDDGLSISSSLMRSGVILPYFSRCSVTPFKILLTCLGDKRLRRFWSTRRSWNIGFFLWWQR
jgi:hypothetical protein